MHRVKEMLACRRKSKWHPDKNGAAHASHLTKADRTPSLKETVFLKRDT